MFVPDFLTDGESVVWQGRPDFARAARRPLSWRTRRLRHLAWLVGCFIVTVASIFWARWKDFPDSLLFVTLVFGMATSFLGWHYFTGKPEAADLASEPPVYLVTNRRVIASVADDARTSVFRLGAGFVDLRPNGEVHDVWIFSSVEDLEMKLEAIPDGPEVEKLVIDTLAAPAEERT